MIHGGKSDPLNKALMKMFNMIGIGERAGSGVPSILQTWNLQGWNSPQVEEQYGPDRTILTRALSVPERQNVGRNVGRENIPAIIIDYIKKNNKITKKIIATELGLSEKTIEREMKKMNNVKFIGRGSNGHWEIIDEE